MDILDLAQAARIADLRNRIERVDHDLDLDHIRDAHERSHRSVDLDAVQAETDRWYEARPPRI